MKNKSTETITISNIRIPCDCVLIKNNQKVIAPGEEVEIEFILETKNLYSFIVESIYLQLLNSEKELKLYVSTEVE